MRERISRWLMNLAILTGLICVGIFSMQALSPSTEINRHELSNGAYLTIETRGGDFVEERIYNEDGQLTSRRYADSSERIHFLKYDPETGDVLEDMIR